MPRVRIRYLSDLHIEFTDYKPDSLPSVGEDFVVLAGDIGEGLRGIAWAQRVLKDRRVVYVLGNHEFYGKNFVQFVGEARAFAANSNVSLLECDQVEVAGLRVLGCTLWTDFLLYGHRERPEMMRHAMRYMADYSEIRSPRGGGLIASETLDRCEKSAAWLRKALRAKDRPTLVVTHHAPSAQNANPDFEGQPSNAAFHSNFDELIASPCLAWIHGHTHHSARTTINGVPLVTNQRGYPNERLGSFAWDRILEVEVPSPADGGAA